VNLARAFDARVGLTGIVLTRVDGDAAAVPHCRCARVTGKPIKLIGTGEKTGPPGRFFTRAGSPADSRHGRRGVAGRKGRRQYRRRKGARVAEKMRKGQFDLADMREQLMQMANMGGISGLMGMMPGIRQDEEPDCQRRDR